MVRMGSLNWQSDKSEINQVEMTTNEKYVHPQYNPETLLNNIALIHLLEDAPQERFVTFQLVSGFWGIFHFAF